MVLMRFLTALVIFSLLTLSAQPVVAVDPAPPAPPFAPHFQKPPVGPRPGAPLPPVQPAVEAPVEPRAAAPSGPAFNWSKTENYLILGTDRREGWTSWRTDTVIILGVDRELNRAAVFSIPRDLYVQIPGYGWGRINQVDYMGEQRNGEGGGPALISEVLSKTLGISTQHWVRLQMDGFVRIVDAIGGVTVNLDCPFYEPIFNLTTQSWDYFTLPAGEVKLDGESAYWFVRLRYRESDIGRGRRQRQFLWGLREQVMQANLIVRLPELWGAFQDTISTDLGLLQLIELARYGMTLDASNVRAGGLTLADLQNYTTEQGAAVLTIGNPARVRAIVEGIWDAPAMVDTNRQDTAQCPPLPVGVEVGGPPAIEAGGAITETAETTKAMP